MKRIYTYLAIILMVPLLIPLNAQIPNSGFEEWVQDGDEYNPVDWTTTNNAPFLNVTPYTPAYAGNFSMKVSTFDAGVMIVPGVATAEFPYSMKPASLSACLKTTVMPGDRVLFIVAMFNQDSIIAWPTDCTFSIDSTIGDFTCFSFPITYQSDLTPDSVTLIIMAGSGTPQAGTEIIVDELFFQENTSIEPLNDSETSVGGNYPNPAGDFTYIPVNLTNESDVVVLIWDGKGSLVQSLPFTSLKPGRHEIRVDTGPLAIGVYPYSVRGKDFTFHGKLVINK